MPKGLQPHRVAVAHIPGQRSWQTEVEPHVRHRDGTVFKPDLVIHLTNGKTVVSYARVSWEKGDSMRVSFERNRSVYHNPKFIEAVKLRWPGMEPLSSGAPEDTLQFTH